jgi:hypothetical protein
MSSPFDTIQHAAPSSACQSDTDVGQYVAGTLPVEIIDVYLLDRDGSSADILGRLYGRSIPICLVKVSDRRRSWQMTLANVPPMPFRPCPEGVCKVAVRSF